jgi:hypothetical protein
MRVWRMSGWRPASVSLRRGVGPRWGAAWKAGQRGKRRRMGWRGRGSRCEGGCRDAGEEGVGTGAADRHAGPVAVGGGRALPHSRRCSRRWGSAPARLSGENAAAHAAQSRRMRPAGGWYGTSAAYSAASGGPASVCGLGDGESGWRSPLAPAAASGLVGLPKEGIRLKRTRLWALNLEAVDGSACFWLGTAGLGDARGALPPFEASCGERSWETNSAIASKMAAMCFQWDAANLYRLAWSTFHGTGCCCAPRAVSGDESDACKFDSFGV